MNQGLNYNVDIVMCIDITGSMHGIIDIVKNNALNFRKDLKSALQEKAKEVNELRVKVIAYRDYYFDGDMSMSESEFFILSEYDSAFSKHISSLTADGGGDEPESGLEALALAINSNWTKGGDKRRQLIVLWTDASAHPLEKAAETPVSGYPEDMPVSFDELTDLWEGQSSKMEYSAKRLLMHAPDAYPWTDIATHWDNVIHYPSKAGEGLSEQDYSSILSAIVNSI